MLAVACDEPVGIRLPDGSRRRVLVTEAETLLVQDEDWQRLSMSEGSKGPRLFDWVAVPILHRWQEDGRHWLLIRRCISDPHEQAYYFVFAPPGTTLQEMVKAIGARWHREEDFEATKDLGLDQYEVRSFIGWYRHVTLVMRAYAFLVGICVQDKAATAQHPPLSPLSAAEVRHQLGHLLWPPPSSLPFVASWSQWRRGHQYCACVFHRQRRLRTG